MLFVLHTFSAQADEVLNVDRALASNIHLSFPNEKDIAPKDSDFAILNYVLMSNEVGERYAVITLVNTSSGTRSLEQDHLIALFADGSRKAPTAEKLNFKGNETQSITVSFGTSKFPILAVYSSNHT